METKQSLVHEERIINAKNGFLMLFVSTLLLAASIAMCILGPVLSGMDRISGGLCGFLIALGLVLFHCVHHSVLRTENLKSERSPCICPFW